MELAISPADPLAAADMQLLTRQTIHAAARANGLRASFAPLVTPEAAGNGWHAHSSVLRDDTNLLAGGKHPHGLTAEGEAWLAGVVRELPALAAIAAPSVPSLLRRRPGYFASAYAFWGIQNREASLRFARAFLPTRTNSKASSTWSPKRTSPHRMRSIAFCTGDFRIMDSSAKKGCQRGPARRATAGSLTPWTARRITCTAFPITPFRSAWNAGATWWWE
jgi:hypothetical protein